MDMCYCSTMYVWERGPDPVGCMYTSKSRSRSTVESTMVGIPCELRCDDETQGTGTCRLARNSYSGPQKSSAARRIVREHT